MKDDLYHLFYLDNTDPDSSRNYLDIERTAFIPDAQYFHRYSIHLTRSFAPGLSWWAWGDFWNYETTANYELLFED